MIYNRDQLPFERLGTVSAVVTLIFWIFIALTSRAENLGAQIVEQLATNSPNASLSVSVGNFLYQDTKQLSAYSAVLETQLEGALARSSRFKLVSRERLAEIQNEVLFRGVMPLDPEQFVGTLKLAEPGAMIRGRFFLKDSNVEVRAELVGLADGKILAQANKTIPQATVIAANPPGIWDFVPSNFTLSEDNIADVERRFTMLPHDFEVELSVQQCRRNFMDGEKYVLRIRAPEACHIAVFDHQVDGSTVLLFPNSYQTNTWIPGKLLTEIPEPNGHGFYLRIAEPFGADVIQVIACTDESNLHHSMARLVAVPSKVGTSLATVSRALLAAQLKRSNLPADSTNTPSAKWAETHFVLSTYPAPVHRSIRPADSLQLNLGPGANPETPAGK